MSATTLFHLHVQYHILNSLINHPHKTNDPESLQFHDDAVHHAHADGTVRHLCKGTKRHIVLEQNVQVWLASFIAGIQQNRQHESDKPPQRAAGVVQFA